MFQVNGAPFLMLAGEAHNSNSSSLAAMEPVWDKARQLCLNTVLLPVSWELIEPEEGSFCFELVDGLISQARSRGLKLGLLWFGAWKNGQCTYAPAWVKTDLRRFLRAEVVKGERKTHLDSFHGIEYSTLSCLCEETRNADSKAFAALMAHLKKVDGSERTVIYVQVENESGVQGAAREHSDYADELFAGEVPAEFARYMKDHTATMREDVRSAVEGGRESGSWEQVFGPMAEEIFQTYYVASYIDAVAAAGKAQYDIPLAVNAWLEQGPPGSYPTGGPVSKMIEVYQFAAPHIDVICPDIYVRDFCGVCDAYSRPDNPLLIPETATHSHAGPRLVYSVGHYHAWGFSPFGFEEMGDPFDNVQGFLFGMDTTDPLLSTPQNAEEYAWYNRTLAQMTPLLAEAYGTEKLQAVISEVPEKTDMRFERFTFRALMDTPMMARKDSVCLALQTAEDEFYLLVNACMLQFLSSDSEKPNVDILALEEGELSNGYWKMYRRLNGDEAFTLTFGKPTLLRVKLFAYR